MRTRIAKVYANFASAVVVGACALTTCAVSDPLPARAGGTPLTTVLVASGLDRPVFVTYAPGDFERVFIVEQSGTIRILKNATLLATPFLDLGLNPFAATGEQGLLGLAFHPDYAQNGFFYVNFTDDFGDTVIRRYAVSANADLADAASALDVLTIDQPNGNHNGGWIQFGLDDYLYIANGDGGAAFDSGVGHTSGSGNAQDITDNLFGKLLRIDVDADDFPDDALRNYAIPPGNPFTKVAGDDEIWLYGVRNPWRCAFDAINGDLYIADVGQNEREEINVLSSDVAAGANLGWRCLEGSLCTGRSGCDCADTSLIAPVHEYPHGGTPFKCSITGGEVYRGCAIPDLVGTYFFADFCGGNISSFRYDRGVTQLVDRTAELAPGLSLSISSISSFGRDAFGELYICDHGGEVFKIVPDVAAAPLTIISSVPSDGAIDARQPFEPDGTKIAGWQAVELTFNGCVSSVARADVVVTQSGGSMPAPSVDRVERISGDSLRVVLDRAIEARSWTTVSYASAGAVMLGSLPADVNADGRSDTTDLETLINSLSGIGAPLQVRSGDIDRSGAVAPGDILRAIDLLRGAGAYDRFDGAALP